MERRLAAIMSTDVVGYSRLMEADEAGTFAALKAHRGEPMDALIAEHHGRIVQLMGDGALVEFPSIAEAGRMWPPPGISGRGRGVPDRRGDGAWTSPAIRARLPAGNDGIAP